MSVNWALPFEEKLIPPGYEGKVVPPSVYQAVHKVLTDNYKEYWESVAKELEWFKPWEKVLDDSRPPFYKWFVGGELNLSYLAVDRHAKSWRKNKVAIIWEGEPVEDGKPKEVRVLT